MQPPIESGNGRGSDPANDRRVRVVRRLGAIILVATGLVWIGQGIGLIPGSFMTGDPFWAVMGGIALIIGVLMARLALADGHR